MRFLSLLLAGIIGGLITLGGYKFLAEDKTFISKSSDTMSFDRIDSSDTDFTAASRKVLPAAVHITALISPSNPMTDEQHPFRDFFGDEFWRRHFQPGPSRRPQIGSGSGVLISNNGYVVTNLHVISNAQEIQVTLNDNRSYKAELVGADPSTDIALLKIKAKNLPYATFTNSDKVRVGDWVLAVGNPFNLSSTVTAGIVSAKARNINILQDNAAIESFIQTDAAVNPGNSGGALVNLNGELIGINTAIATPTGTYAGYSFAVPSNIVVKVIEDLREFGEVHRAYLGVIIRDLDPVLSRNLGLNIPSGVYVDSLMKNGAAASAGIQKGDVIIEVDNAKIKSTPHLLEQIGRHRPGDKIKVIVFRNGKEKEIPVTLKGADKISK